MPNVQPYAKIPLIPGPTTVPTRILDAMYADYGSGQVESEFMPFYNATAARYAQLMQTSGTVVFMTGEGMLALWSGLNSCLQPGDKVLSIGTGVFGDGIGEMAASIGCEVTSLSFPYNTTIGCADSLQQIEDAIRRVKPKMITAVHCETPSGTLNPLDALGEMKHRLGVPLLYVDAVASLGGVPVHADTWHIDLLLAGSQKCLSAPPSMSIMAVSDTAWEFVKKTGYQGYDALLPFASIRTDTRCPYTPYWHGIAALSAAIDLIEAEGTQKVFSRHTEAARRCREGIAALGINLFPTDDAIASPTVTAACIPDGISWEEWRHALREKGLVVSGSFGPMAGKVFRLGHMGAQADTALIDDAIAALRETLKQFGCN